MIDQTSGGSIHINSLVNAFKSLGHEVLLDAPKSGQSGTMVGKVAGKWSKLKSITPSYIWLTIRDTYDVWKDIKNVPRIKGIMEKFKPDIVFERNAYLQTAGATAAIEKGIPYFLEIVSPAVEERSEVIGAPLGWYHNKKELERAKAAEGIIVLSNVVKRILVERGADSEKIAVFPIAVAPERFKDCKTKGLQLRERLGMKGPVVGFVGSIAAYHGVGQLIEAAVSIKKDFPDALVWIVGGGESLPELRSRAEKMGLDKNVRFEGFVPSADVPAYMAAFDVAVLPGTAYYGSPIKLCEYGAAGVPVIAPRIESIEEMFGDPEVAVLIRPEENLSDAVINLLKDRDRAKNLGENIRRLVLSKYTWIEVAGSMINFIEERLS